MTAAPPVTLAVDLGTSGVKVALVDDGGRVLATFAPQRTSLAGTSWRVTGYNNGRQAVVSVANGTTLTVAFDGTGRVTGSAGCNRFTGTYVQDGETLKMQALAATRRICGEPVGVMEQERTFLRALESAASVRFEGDRAEVRTTDGALAATLARAGG